MPPPSDHPAFQLSLLLRPFKVEQFKPEQPIPHKYIELLANGNAGRFVSVTRTDEETSVVVECLDEDTEATWRCIKIAGPMDFGSLIQ